MTKLFIYSSVMLSVFTPTLVSCGKINPKDDESLIQTITPSTNNVNIEWSFSPNDPEKHYLDGSNNGYAWGGCGHSIEKILSKMALTFEKSCRTHVYYGPHISFPGKGNARVEVDFLSDSNSIIMDSRGEAYSCATGIDVVANDINGNPKTLYNATPNFCIPGSSSQGTYTASFLIENGDHNIAFRINRVIPVSQFGISEVRFSWSSTP